MRKNNRFAAVALLATVGILGTACGSDSKKADLCPGVTKGSVSTPPLKLGVAFDTGGRGDGTFNDSAARGADKAKSDLGATVDEL